MNKPKPPADFDDNPEWTETDFAQARQAGEVLPSEAVAALTKRGRGRPAGSDKERVTLRIDRETLERFRAGGPGWQTRINDALRKALV